MTVVEFIYRKAGEVFNFTKNSLTLPLSTSRNLENLHNIYFLHTCSYIILLVCDATVFFIRYKSLQFVFYSDTRRRSLLSVCLITFLQDHLLFPIFCANTNFIFYLKLTYFCIPNLKAKIDEHNNQKQTTSKNKIMLPFEKRKTPNERSLPH